MKRITIYDVAKEADVSLATVSRVINGSEVVREDTRIKVQEDHCLILWQIQEIRLCIQTIYHKVPGQIVIYLYHSFITAYHCNLHTIPPYAIVCRKQAFAIRKAVCAWK